MTYWEYLRQAVLWRRDVTRRLYQMQSDLNTITHGLAAVILLLRNTSGLSPTDQAKLNEIYDRATAASAKIAAATKEQPDG